MEQQRAQVPGDTPPQRGSLFDWATHFDTLWAAWEKVWANHQGAAGGDHMTVQAFSIDTHQLIARLRP